MDNVFARCADLVALAGRPGVRLRPCVERVLGTRARPALVNWLERSFSARPLQFTVSRETLEGTDEQVVRVVASQPLRERAMGFSLLEHAPLQASSMDILEAVGQTGQEGILQSELGPKVNLIPVMVHHYLGALIALKLVARRKVVLTSHKASRIDERGVRMPRSLDEPGAETGDTAAASYPAEKPMGNVTQTSVIVLARFASSIDSSNATELLSTPAGAVPATEDHPQRALFNVKAELRTERVLDALQRSEGGVLPQRDLKLIAIPDSECGTDSSRHKFVRRRHRIFRVVRARMLKANLVTAVMKECIDVQGKSLGELPCFQLAGPSESAAKDGTVSGTVAQVVTAAAAQADSDNEDDENAGSDEEEDEISKENPDGTESATPGAVFEVDVAEQVYHALEKSGSRGMSCPDVVSYLDGDTGMTGIEYKRTRTLLKSIHKTNPMQNLQHFDGSACHMRFVLKKNHIATGTEWPREPATPSKKKSISAADPAGSKMSSSGKKSSGRRTTSGTLTSLGQQRRKIVEDLLNDKKVLQFDKIGREVANAEGASHPVDSKVIRRVVDSLLTAGVCRVMEVNKPSLTPSRKAALIKLLVLSGVTSNGPEIRTFLSSIVKRSVVANKDSFLPPTKPKVDRKPKRKGSKKTTPTGKSKASTATETVQDITTTDGIKVFLGTPSAPGEPNELGHLAELKSPEVQEGEISRPVQAAVESSPIVNLALMEEAPLSSRIVVKAIRAEEDPRTARIAKLRAVDYGWIKPKMQRVRLFHEHLVRHVCGEDFFLGALAGNSDIFAEHSTFESAAEAEDLGYFNLQESFMSMSVRQFANIIGLHYDHGVISEEVFQLPMEEAPEGISAEAKSKAGTGKVRILFSVLLRLGLVHSAEDSSWVLRGAGVYRDFGRGIPSGATPHCIKFSSHNAIRSFWDELESLANSTGLSLYVTEAPVASNNRLNKSNDGSDFLRHLHEVAQVLDVYVPARWLPGKSGNSKKLADEELKMEAVLQTIISAGGWADDYTLPKDISNWTLGPIRRISIDEVHDNAVLLFPPSDPRRKTFVKHSDMEKLLMYSRKRTRIPISSLVLRLARKPTPRFSHEAWRHVSPNPSSQNYVDKSETVAPPKKRRANSLSSPRSKRNKQLIVEHAVLQPELTSQKLKQTDLYYVESSNLLTAVTQANAIIQFRQHQGTPLTTEENHVRFWRQVSDAVHMSSESCKTLLDMLRKPIFVQRHLDMLCDRLVERLAASDSSFLSDGPLQEVPANVFDCYGEEIPVNTVVRSILGESGLNFLRRKGESIIRRSKRRSVLARLRSPSQVPATSAAAEAAQKRQRRRTLASFDNSPAVLYGLIKADESDHKWVEPYSLSAQLLSEARRSVISLLLIAILAEEESSFCPHTALYVLSRFSKTEILHARNHLHQQKCLTLHDDGRRLFELETMKKPMDIVFTAETLEKMRMSNRGAFFHETEHESGSNSGILERISSMDGIVSQSALAVTVQWMLLPGDKPNLSLSSRLLKSTDADGGLSDTDLVVDFSLPFSTAEDDMQPQRISVERESVVNSQEVEQDTLQKSPILTVGNNKIAENLTKKSTGQEQTGPVLSVPSKKKTLANPGAPIAVLDEVRGGALSDQGAEPSVSADGMRIEDEWVHEVNIRRVRELEKIESYTSHLKRQQTDTVSLGEVSVQAVTCAVLDWISKSRSKGFTSLDISAKASGHGFPGAYVVRSVCNLLREGIVHRFASDEYLQHDGLTPAVYFLTSYAWAFVTVPLLKSASNKLTADWTSARLISPWVRINGMYNAELVKTVQVHIFDILARAPGTEGGALATRVQAREPALPRRAILDAATALTRAGIVKREVREYNPEPITLFSSRTVGCAPHLEPIVLKFPDGFELANFGERVQTFYSLSASTLGNLLDAETLDTVAEGTM